MDGTGKAVGASGPSACGQTERGGRASPGVIETEDPSAQRRVKGIVKTPATLQTTVRRRAIAVFPPTAFRGSIGLSAPKRDPSHTGGQGKGRGGERGGKGSRRTCVRAMPLERVVGTQAKIARPTRRPWGSRGRRRHSGARRGVKSRMEANPNARAPLHDAAGGSNGGRGRGVSRERGSEQLGYRSEGEGQ
jgi:hypothetical protein